MMNERIQQLAEQAYLYQEHDTFLIAALENFAELIVRQCAEIADTAEPFLASDLIKEHFGVEE
jgi:hypothetical protein